VSKSHFQRTFYHFADRQYILDVLEKVNWVLGGANGAATRLGMKRSTLQWKVKKLNISRPR